MIIDDKLVQLRWYRPESKQELSWLADLHLECLPTELWKPKDFTNFVGGGHGNNNVVKVAASEDGCVYGSLLYTLEESALRLRRVCVTGTVRRQGLATFMINALCGPRSPIRRRRFVARVRESNYPAQALLAGLGFAFDPHKDRQLDEANQHYYAFALDKDAVPA